MKQLNLSALSPLDGRYAEQLAAATPILSEYGLMRYRLEVELQWLALLMEKTELASKKKLKAADIKQILANFDVKECQRIKEIEQTIQHDVKAVEYYVKEKLRGLGYPDTVIEFVHFACTSEDINNLAYSLMLQNARKELLLPELDKIIQQLVKMAEIYADQAMLARTHGQSASPTTVGKELANVAYRLALQSKRLKQIPLYGKINGATGNFNAHQISCPEVDWIKLSEEFVTSLKLEWQPYTTQILPHDDMAEFAQTIQRINTVLIDFCRDTWGYISLDYFKQKLQEKEVGSSTMPHKINPIQFENAEGNLGLANSLLIFFAEKLPISRWQRDLTDSTVLRNWGVAIGHSLLAYQMILKGLSRLDVNVIAIQEDLEKHWEVLAEAIQTVMRRYGHEAPYEKLKKLTRGRQLTTEEMAEFIKSLDLSVDAKERLLALTPRKYIGYAKELAIKIKKYIS